MRPYRAAIAAITVGLAAILILVLAIECSGGSDDAVNGSPTATGEQSGSNTPQPTVDVALQPYFQQLASIFQKASDDNLAAVSELDQARSNAQTLEDTKAAYATFLTATQSAFDTAIGAMNQLDVPAEAKDDHTAFVNATTQSRQLAEQFMSDVANTTTQQELDDLLNNFGADKGPLLTTIDDACAGLQETATSHGVDVDLGCIASGG
jgi:hypothetical protein